jgi:flavin-dependent thymidylate synthase
MSVCEVKLLNHFGTDKEICASARISYNNHGLQKTDAQNQGLLNYLAVHGHCYDPEMEVLTAEGWKKWKNCNEYENFAIPTMNNEIHIERLPVKIFPYNDTMYCYKNNRMSFKVTKGHRMFFKTMFKKRYEIYKIEEMSQWGYFYSIKHFFQKIENPCKKFMLIGFFLGDGTGENNKSVLFNLKKQRKIDFVIHLLEELNIEYKVLPQKSGSTNIRFTAPDFLHAFTGSILNKRQNKQFVGDITLLKKEELKGLLDGLVNSDGSIKKGRPQIEFSSCSSHLVKLFETIASLLGYECHFCKSHKRTSDNQLECFSVKLHWQLNRRLQARKQYFFQEQYNGLVYCTTSSTGLLFVRGSDESAGFVCGNSSPFEQAEYQFFIKLPLFVFGQLVRHRTANINCKSYRYTEVEDLIEFYIPKFFRQTDEKKQGSSSLPIENNSMIVELCQEKCRNDFRFYKKLLEEGVCREQARMFLPQNIFTEFVWKIDLRNLYHFIDLRIHHTAQAEIQVLAQKLLFFVKEKNPMTYNALSNSKKDITIEELKYIMRHDIGSLPSVSRRKEIEKILNEV